MFVQNHLPCTALPINHHVSVPSLQLRHAAADLRFLVGATLLTRWDFQTGSELDVCSLDVLAEYLGHMHHKPCNNLAGPTCWPSRMYAQWRL